MFDISLSNLLRVIGFGSPCAVSPKRKESRSPGPELRGRELTYSWM